MAARIPPASKAHFDDVSKKLLDRNWGDGQTDLSPICTCNDEKRLPCEREKHDFYSRRLEVNPLEGITLPDVPMHAQSEAVEEN